MSFEVGQRVDTDKNGKGKVAFVGTTQFAEGDWIGVILDEPKGKNNGNVQGVQYFNCDNNYGLFIRPAQLKIDNGRGMKGPSSALKAPSSSLRKDSVHSSLSRLSPGSSPKMSPSVSRENLSRPNPSNNKKSSIATHSESSKMIPPSSSRKESSSRIDRMDDPQSSNTSPSSSTPPSVLSRVKKMEEDTVVAPSVPLSSIVPQGMDEGTELELLRVEVKDLGEKLETLRMKRKEDREKLVEYERMKIQLQSLSEYKNRAQDAHSNLLRELQEKKQEADVLREWKESTNEELTAANDQMEMITLDKEMAEEKAEQLQEKVDELQSKVDELEADLSIMREEMGNGGRDGVPEGNSVQMKQIQQQNERLREALIKMRDVNGNAMAEKQSAEKELDKLRCENAELLRMGELWKKKSEDSEEAIVNLKEQVDAFLGSEDVIQHLTDRNLDMEEKIRSLEIDKEDLEAMRDMDEQIAEEQKEVEKVLRKEIEALQVTINELLLRQRQDESHSEQLSQTIIKFRKKTAELNADIEDFKDQILQLEKEVNNGREGEKDRAGQASLALISASRQFAISVESRIRSIELQFADKHIKYLKAFLPDNFTRGGGDNDCVSVSLIVPRIGEKAIALSSLLKEKFPHVPGGMRLEHVSKSHKGEQWAHVYKASHLCSSIYNVCGQIESALSTCTVDTLSTIGHLRTDFSLQEKHIDNYIELLKSGRMDENSSLDQLEGCVRYFTKRVMEDQLSGRDTFDGYMWTIRSCQCIVDAIEWWNINEKRIIFLITSESSEVVDWVKSIGVHMTTVEQLTRKIKTRLSTPLTLILTESFYENLSRSLSLIHRISSLIHDTCALAATQLSMLSGEASGFDCVRVKEMFHCVFEKSFGKISLDKVFQPVDKDVSILTSCIHEVYQTIDGGLMESTEKKDNKYPPLIERALTRKQGATESEGLRWQIEKKESEIMELKKVIKARMDDVSNYKLRLEMSDARLEQSSKVDSEKESHLQMRIDQLNLEMKKQKNQYEETLDALQKDLRNAESDNNELKERQKNLSKKALLQGIQNMENMEMRSPTRSLSSNVSNGGVSSAEVAILESQLGDALDTLRRTTIEMRKAKASSSTLSSLHLPTSICGPFSLSLKESKNDPLFDSIESEANHLQREEARFAFFTPNPLKSFKENESERERWMKDRELFQFRVQSCRNRLHDYWRRNYPEKEVPRLIGVQKKENIVPQSELNIHSKTFKDICGKWGIATA